MDHERTNAVSNPKHFSSVPSMPISAASKVAILSSSMPLARPGSSSASSSRDGESRVSSSSRSVVVIFDASREMSTSALEWTLERVIRPRDVLTQLGVLQQISATNFPGIAKLMRHKSHKSQRGMELDHGVEEEISRKLKLYTPMLTDIQKTCEEQSAKFELRISYGHPLSVIAVNETRKLKPTWIILDRNMKRHSKYISDQLSCNTVLMDRINEGKILKLCAPVMLGPSLQFHDVSSDSVASVLDHRRIPRVSSSGGESDSPSEAIPKHETSALPEANARIVRNAGQNESAAEETAAKEEHRYYQPEVAIESTTEDDLQPEDSLFELSTNAGSLALCSVCKHRSRELKWLTRAFTYAELEEATESFSSANFLAEGGFGSVYKGVLRDGQEIAVKQHKLASTQGEREFCAEIRVLSGAQHRNLVTLLGCCYEDGRRILVYQFVCNKSLDVHLFDKFSVLPWPARQGIALGAARAMRYLHQECRVGTIIHRDLRPHNILLTHDYTPMVGDFGLARWHTQNELAVETKVIGTFGYMAPEYAASGQITEKADVYSFGVVLLEMVTGRRALDTSLPAGEQCLTEWARPKLDVRDVEALVDPRLSKEQLQGSNLYELQAMVHAAAFCLRREPSQRPKMSQVLRILEGERSEVSISSLAVSTTSEAGTKSRIPRVPNSSTLSRSPVLLSYNEMIR